MARGASSGLACMTPTSCDWHAVALGVARRCPRRSFRAQESVALRKNTDRLKALLRIVRNVLNRLPRKANLAEVGVARSKRSDKPIVSNYAASEAIHGSLPIRIDPTTRATMPSSLPPWHIGSSVTVTVASD
jgi:hypothetical protein